MNGKERNGNMTEKGEAEGKEGKGKGTGEKGREKAKVKRKEGKEKGERGLGMEPLVNAIANQYNVLN